MAAMPSPCGQENAGCRNRKTVATATKKELIAIPDTESDQDGGRPQKVEVPVGLSRQRTITVERTVLAGGRYRTRTCNIHGVNVALWPLS